MLQPPRFLPRRGNPFSPIGENGRGWRGLGGGKMGGVSSSVGRAVGKLSEFTSGGRVPFLPELAYGRYENKSREREDIIWLILINLI